MISPPFFTDVCQQTAVAFWSVLLGPKYPLMKDVITFINVGPVQPVSFADINPFLQEKGSYRAANKDLWNMVC
jgi:DCN1-like protein 4/5